MTAGSAAPTRFHGLLADGRVKSCMFASCVSIDRVVTNTSRDASAIRSGQVSAQTGEAKIVVAANIRTLSLRILRMPHVFPRQEWKRQIAPLSIRDAGENTSATPCPNCGLRVNHWQKPGGVRSG